MGNTLKSINCESWPWYELSSRSSSIRHRRASGLAQSSACLETLRKQTQSTAALLRPKRVETLQRPAQCVSQTAARSMSTRAPSCHPQHRDRPQQQGSGQSSKQRPGQLANSPCFAPEHSPPKQSPVVHTATQAERTMRVALLRSAGRASDACQCVQDGGAQSRSNQADSLQQAHARLTDPPHHPARSKTGSRHGP